VVTLDDVRRAARAGSGIVRETPVLSSRTLGERSGGEVVSFVREAGYETRVLR
jgi:threonine dehydratase